MADALRSATRLDHGQVLVASTDQCENLEPNRWVVTLKPVDSRSTAALLADEWKRRGRSDAYVRLCRVRPDSPLAIGQASVDPSIAEVPANAVNWSDEDRVSRAALIPGKRVLYFQRQYHPDPEDPREGRRTSVWLKSAPGEKLMLLARDCEQAKHAATDTHVALSCAAEVAGDHLLHTVALYDATTGRRSAQIERCRQPRLSDTGLSCLKESVNADNRLSLALVRVPLRR